MNILIVGGGGREHALAWKISQSKKVKKIFCAPGNAGISNIAECLPIGAEDIHQLLDFAKANEIDFTVVGPEAPLSMGIVDQFEKEGLRIFGASQKAAELESSKSFAKRLMRKYNIPTASGAAFDNYEDAEKFIHQMGAPIVVKADGLAAGKGVIVCSTVEQAIDALKRIIIEKEFGDAGDLVVIEERLVGEEASFLAFTDGHTVLPLPSSQDHKPSYDNDEGANTGGMGAYSPAPVVDGYMHRKVMRDIIIPTVKGMESEGRPYKGVLYAGLMIDGENVKVLEFNARFGDPEAQPLLIRLKNDLLPILEAIVDGRLDEYNLEIERRSSVCVVMASGGYPGSYEKGFPIKGLDQAAKMDDVMVFHAGTAESKGDIVTSGGRVLGVTALGDDVAQAIENAYKAVSVIDWKSVHYRKDIGQKALLRREIQPDVAIVMGSDSDLDILDQTAAVLKQFGIPYEMTVASAHRSPEKAVEIAKQAEARGIKIIIAGAGHAAHLAGVLSAHTNLPIIGVPIDSSCLNGFDSLLSTVQMPPGVPVATMAIGKSGARNAGILAAQILSLQNPDIREKLEGYKKEMARQVERRAEKINIC